MHFLGDSELIVIAKQHLVHFTL